MDPDLQGKADGADRLMPAPDELARDYLLLALRVNKLLPGLVDAYFGPPELKAQVEAEPPRTADRLREDASSLNSRVASEAKNPDRQRWLRAQLVALEAQALMVAGDPLPFSDYVACLFDGPPHRTAQAGFEVATQEIGRLLPSPQSSTDTVGDRLAAWEGRFAIAQERLPAVVQWLVNEVRGRVNRLLGLPAGERVEFVYVSGGPWTAFNQYEGGGRTLIELNTELANAPAELIRVATVECYPGRHTEHAWKERRLVRDLGRLEGSVALLNTPEALISEGMAVVGERFIVPDTAMADLLVELYRRGGLAVAADPAAARDAAASQVRIRRAQASLRSVTSNAAFMLHADGVGRDEVAEYLRQYLLIGSDRAEKRLALIEDPIGRAQVVAGHEGERLLRRWLELSPTAEQLDRFGRLLREQLTPGTLSDELNAVGFGQDGW